MNRVLLSLFFVVAFVSAESWHEMWVNCFPEANHTLNRYGGDSQEFLLTVAEANRHLNTRIFICCHLGLFSEQYANGGDQTLFDFKFNVELVGLEPQ